MKLKLENQDTIAVISVSEEVLSPHIAILKAGISKLIQTGKKNILLDLTSANHNNPEITKDILSLEQFTSQLNGKLVIVSSIAAVGHAQNRKNGLLLFPKDLSLILATEVSFNVQFERLEKQKQEIEKKLPVLKVGALEPKNLRKENSTLKKNIQDLETIIQKFMKQRIEVKPSPPITSRSETINKTVIAVLEQEGIIPVK